MEIIVQSGHDMRVARAAALLSSENPERRPVPRMRSNVLQMTTATEAPGVTNKRYWDEAAEEWDEFQDTFATDLWGTIKRSLGAQCHVADECIDFGCGGGRYLAFLAPRVRHILGLDVSQKLLDIAHNDVVSRRGLRNVTLQQADLGTPSAAESLDLPPCDLAICANVLISPEPSTVRNILYLMARSVRCGGRLFVVVPSVGSALNIRDQHARWLQERRRLKIPRDFETERPELSNDADERCGVFQRAGVRTQHYKLLELQSLLAAAGFDRIVVAERVEYAWNTEFERPTRFLEKDRSVARPHDWCLVAVRNGEPARRAGIAADGSVPAASLTAATEQAAGTGTSGDTAASAKPQAKIAVAAVAVKHEAASRTPLPATWPRSAMSRIGSVAAAAQAATAAKAREDASASSMTAARRMATSVAMRPVTAPAADDGPECPTPGVASRAARAVS